MSKLNHKKYTWLKKAVSIMLCLSLMLSSCYFVFSPSTVLAADISDSRINPGNGNLEIDFVFQYSQRVDVDVKRIDNLNLEELDLNMDDEELRDFIEGLPIIKKDIVTLATDYMIQGQSDLPSKLPEDGNFKDRSINTFLLSEHTSLAKVEQEEPLGFRPFSTAMSTDNLNPIAVPVVYEKPYDLSSTSQTESYQEPEPVVEEEPEEPFEEADPPVEEEPDEDEEITPDIEAPDPDIEAPNEGESNLEENDNDGGREIEETQSNVNATDMAPQSAILDSAAGEIDNDTIPAPAADNPLNNSENNIDLFQTPALAEIEPIAAENNDIPAQPTSESELGGNEQDEPAPTEQPESSTQNDPDPEQLPDPVEDPTPIPEPEIEPVFAPAAEGDGEEVRMRLSWDMRYPTTLPDGTQTVVPVLGNPDENRLYFMLQISIYPRGIPDHAGHKDCWTTTNSEGESTHHHGTNYTWPDDPDNVITTLAIVDYRAGETDEHGNPLASILLLNGGLLELTIEEMIEYFYINNLDDLLALYGEHFQEAYKVAYEAEDLECFVAEPVHMVLGNFYFSYTDLILHGAQPLSFKRMYNSRYIDEDAPLGRGFSHGYDYKLTDDRGIIRIVMPYGEELRFMLTEEAEYYGYSETGFTLQGAAGGGYLLKYKTGTEFDFNAAGQLTAVRNPGGTTVATLAYDGGNLSQIRSPGGYYYNLSWSGGHITRVEDSAGRSVSYSYQGNLLTSFTNADGKALRYQYDVNGYLNEATDFEGDTYLYNTYDGYGRVTAQTFVNAGQNVSYQFEYNDDARVNTFINESGLRSNYYYDKDRNLLRVEVEDTGAANNTFNGNNKIDSYTNRAGNTIEYVLDDEGRIIQTTYPDGNIIKYEYTNANFLSKKTYKDGSTEEYEYDNNQNITRYKDRNGNVTRYEYTNNYLTKEINALGDATTFEYDNQGRMVRTIDALGGVTRYVYDNAGQFTQIIDANGNATSYEYTTAGLLKKLTDALGNSVTYTYDDNGYLTSTTDVLGKTSYTTYYTNGKPSSTIDANGNTTTYIYNENGMLAETVDPLGNATKNYYNDHNHLIKTVNADGVVKEYEYDEMDRHVATIDGNGNRTEYVYDEMGRLSATIDANGGRTEYEFNDDGRTIVERDAEGHETRYTYDYNGNVLTVRDAEGVVTHTTYSALNQVLTQSDGEGYVTSYSYDALGRIKTVTDPDNGVTAYEYDAVGNQIRIVDRAGRVTEFEYDALYRVTKQTNLVGTELEHSQTFVYDAAGQLLESYDALGRLTSFTYDAVGNRLSSTDPKGNITTYEYDANYRNVAVVYPDGGRQEYSYTPGGSNLTSTDQLGNVTSYSYNDLGRLDTLTDGAGHVTRYEYDAVGNQIARYVDNVLVQSTVLNLNNRATAVYDGNGNATAYTYNGVGHTTTVTDREGNTTSYTYDKNYQTTAITDANGGVLRHVYDIMGRKTSATDPMLNTTYYTYDILGNLLETKDALGQTYTYAYDLMGRTVSETDKMGNSTTYTYDIVGNLLTVTDAVGEIIRYAYDEDLDWKIEYQNRENDNEVVRYEYDIMGRLIKTVNEIHHTERYEYDLAGNTIAYIDGNGNRTTFEYDGANRQTTITNPIGNKQQVTYDGRGNILTITVDAANNQRATTTYTYDAADRLIQETSPLRFITVYEYDKEGNLTRQDLANDAITDFEYDALHNLVKRTDSMGEAAYSYDAVGNLLSASDATGTVAFAYDAIYRTTQTTVTITDAEHLATDTFITSYSFDANDNITEILYPDLTKVQQTYDNLNRLTSLIDQDGSNIHYIYDKEGRLLKETHSDGSTSEYDYNAAGQLTLEKQVIPGSNSNPTRRQTSYIYNDNGTLRSETRTGIGINHKDETIYYSYDAADRLTEVATFRGDMKDQVFTYDLAGNLLNDGESTYNYDLQNRLTSKLTRGQITVYAYDGYGNLVLESSPNGSVEYTYDDQSRLIQGVTGDGEISTYAYNALGARVQNVQLRENINAGHANNELDNGSRNIRDYLGALMDGRYAWQRVWETEVRTTVQNDYETVTKHYITDYLSFAYRDMMVYEEGSYSQRYVYAPDGARVSAAYSYAAGTTRGEGGENIASDIADGDVEKIWYRRNSLHSSVYAVNKLGNIVAHMIYDAWGMPLIETKLDLNYAGIDNLNNYTGYTYDEVLGLYFAQNRFYDAELHRFTQQDEAKDGTNWYVYCWDDPVNNVDPSGNNTMGKGVSAGIMLLRFPQDLRLVHGDGWTSRIELNGTVKLVQSTLNEAGYNSGAVDGKFGGDTLRAVNKFKNEHLPGGNTGTNYGVFGYTSWTKLVAVWLMNRSSATSPYCPPEEMPAIIPGQEIRADIPAFTRQYYYQQPESGPCPAYASAMALAIYVGYEMPADKIAQDAYYANGLMHWGVVGLSIQDNFSVTQEEALNNAYKELQAGKPSVFLVKGSYSQHWVTIIGYSNHTTDDFSNFLIMDPGFPSATSLNDKEPFADPNNNTLAVIEWTRNQVKEKFPK